MQTPTGSRLPPPGYTASLALRGDFRGVSATLAAAAQQLSDTLGVPPYRFAAWALEPRAPPRTLSDTLSFQVLPPLPGGVVRRVLRRESARLGAGTKSLIRRWFDVAGEDPAPIEVAEGKRAQPRAVLSGRSTPQWPAVGAASASAAIVTAMFAQLEVPSSPLRSTQVFGAVAQAPGR